MRLGAGPVMRWLRWPALGLFLVIAATLAASGRPTEANSFGIRNVRVFDGEKILDGTTVIVRGGLIEQIDPSAVIPMGLRVIDGEGKTLLPGFIDAHAHARFESVMADAIRFGVTTQLDMFTSVRFAAEQRPRRNNLGPTQLPDMWSAGTLVTSPGGLNAQNTGIPTLSDPKAADAFVRARIDEGSDYIKIVYEPAVPNFSSISRETLAATIRAAHAQGKMALVHATRREAAREAVKAGADGLVHVFIYQPIDAALLELMAEKDVFVVPTLSVFLSLQSDEQPGRRLAEDARLAPWLSLSQRQFLASRPGPLPPGMTKIDPKHLRFTVAELHRRGIDILVGSDASNPGTAHGATIHGELAELVRAGLTPLDALASATRLPAERFGLTDRGRIAPGLRADLILVEGDPTTNILETRAIDRVFKNGFEIIRSRP